jgi:hypothetical protein
MGQTPHQNTRQQQVRSLGRRHQERSIPENTHSSDEDVGQVTLYRLKSYHACKLERIKMYKIMVKQKDCPVEEVDSFTKKEGREYAERMLTEYRMVYPGCRVWIRTRKKRK